MRKINRPHAVVAILVFGLACSKGGGSNSDDGGAVTSGGGGSTGGAGAMTSGSGGMSGGSDGSQPGSTGGNGGGATGGTSGGSGGMAGTVPEGNSVLQRNHHATRDGHYVQSTLTKATATKMAMDPTFNATFAGRFFASPLYVEDGPNHKGVFIVGSTSNDVVALDETTGAMVWTKNIGTVATASGVGCGNVNPRGIVGTPVIDLDARTIYAVGAMGPGATTHYEAHALSIDDGSEKAGWPAIIDGKIMSSEGGLAFDPHPENQRGALSLVNGILYVPFGGHDGDCGGYHGWVVAVDTKNPAMVAGWATKGAGGAIWASGGMASDGTGVFATTGNGYGAGGANLDSEAVVRIRGMASLTRGNADIFYPTAWKAIDGGDDDMGATSPVVFDLPGATPMKMVASAAKQGHVYFMKADMMGGMGGNVAEHVAATATHSLRTALTSYKTATGTFVALTVDRNASCAGDRVLMSIKVNPGPPVTTATAWCLPIGGLEDTACGRSSAPMITTTDGMSDAIVWIMSGANLVGVDGDTGAMITSVGTCGPPHHWTAPIAVKGRIIVGVDGRLCSWSVH